jgi:very-short-patch-repair endonuclease
MSQEKTKYLPKELPETISTRFAASFSDYAARTEYLEILHPVEQELNIMAIAATMGRSLGPDARELVTTAARGLTKQSVVGTIRSVVCGAAHCESVIELSLCLSLGMAARAKGYAVLYDFGGCNVYGDPDGETTVRVQPQLALYNFRVDFLVTMNRVEDSAAGVEVSSHQIVVECDGHEFHERTREQATSDRERDRMLQFHGLGVLRFTGSDIWTDTFKCSEEILSFLRTNVDAPDHLSRKKPPASCDWPARIRPLKSSLDVS